MSYNSYNQIIGIKRIFLRVGSKSQYYNNIPKDIFDIYQSIKKAPVDKRNKCPKWDELYLFSDLKNIVISPKSVSNYFKE